MPSFRRFSKFRIRLCPTSLFPILSFLVIVVTLLMLHTRQSELIQSGNYFRLPSFNNPRTPVHLILHYYQQPNFTVFSYDERWKIPGNLGDLVWTHAALNSIPDLTPNSVFHCALVDGCVSKITESFQSHPVVVHFPCANLLYAEKVGMLRLMRHYAEHPRVMRVIVNGIGTQMHLSSSSINDSELTLEKWEQMASTYNITEEMSDHLSALNFLPFDLLSRGELTSAVARRAGLSTVITSGCPSLFINEELGLGSQLAQKYARLATRIGDTSLRVAISFEMFYGDWIVFPVLRHRYPNAVFVAQTGQDMKHALKYGVPFENTRSFDNIHDWVNFLGGMDLAFGSRIHSTMAAIAAGIPAVVIAVDVRILELAKRMNIPYVSFHQDVLKGGRIDLAEIASQTNFDGTKFDRNRCETAKLHWKVYHSSGIPVRKHIHELAKNC